MADETEAGPSNPHEDELLKEFFNEMRDVDRDNEVTRILTAFKLNPYEQLNLRFTATLEDVKKQFRKVSLVVHPDKCKHPNAKDAFDILRTAQEFLNDEEKCKELNLLLGMAREEVLKERKKSAKGDVTVQLAALIHADGAAGVEQDWESSEEFHDRWKAQARDYLAKAEFRKRQLNRRIKEEEDRATKERTEEREKEAKKRKLEGDVKKTRDDRVDSWRSFVNAKKPKTEGPEKKKIPVGGLRPPQVKTEDVDRSYVQRVVKKGEDAW